MIICYTPEFVLICACLLYTSVVSLKVLNSTSLCLTINLKTSLSSPFYIFPGELFKKGKVLLCIEILLFSTIDHFTNFEIRKKFSIYTLLW